MATASFLFLKNLFILSPFHHLKSQTHKCDGGIYIIYLRTLLCHARKYSYTNLIISLIVGKINIEEPENVQLAVSLGVNSIPALFFYRNGQLEKQLVGFMKKTELEAQLGL